jgi:hypothetical protein
MRSLLSVSLVCLPVCGLVMTLQGQEEGEETLTAKQEKTLAVFSEHEAEWKASRDVMAAFPVVEVVPNPNGGPPLQEEHIRITTDRSDLFPQEIDGVPLRFFPPRKTLPPPDGIMIVNDKDEWENWPEVDECPEGFVEERVVRWIFCNRERNLVQIPEKELTALPIGGVPYVKAEEIWDRYDEEIFKLPGVVSCGLAADGVHVETTRPELVPSNLEGLPVLVCPDSGAVLCGADLRGYGE